MNIQRRFQARIRWAVLILIASQFGLVSQQISPPREVFAQSNVITVIKEAEDSIQAGAVATGYDATTATTYIEFGAQEVVPSIPPVDPNFQPTPPFYTTFYYPWYQTPQIDGGWRYWQDNGNNPPATWFSHFLPDRDPTAFDPATELYSSNDIGAALSAVRENGTGQT